MHVGCARRACTCRREDEHDKTSVLRGMHVDTAAAQLQLHIVHVHACRIVAMRDEAVHTSKLQAANPASST